MNSVELIGRLVRDPELRYASGSQTAIATFTIAIDRPHRKDEEKKTDFPRIKVFGPQAEACEKYLKKGRLVGVQGSLQTGSYQNRNGETVYTTDVVANRVIFIDWEEKRPEQRHSYSAAANKSETLAHEPSQEQFEAIDEDVPF